MAVAVDFDDQVEVGREQVDLFVVDVDVEPGPGELPLFDDRFEAAFGFGAGQRGSAPPGEQGVERADAFAAGAAVDRGVQLGVGDELENAGFVEFAVELVGGGFAGAVDQGASRRGERESVAQADVTDVKRGDAVDVDAGSRGKGWRAMTVR